MRPRLRTTASAQSLHIRADQGALGHLSIFEEGTFQAGARSWTDKKGSSPGPPQPRELGAGAEGSHTGKWPSHILLTT